MQLMPSGLLYKIILGAYEVLKEEESMVEVEIPADQTIDV